VKAQTKESDPWQGRMAQRVTQIATLAPDHRQRRIPKEALREGRAARSSGVRRELNPYASPPHTSATNNPEVKASIRMRAGWWQGWDAADAELQQP